jgi:membrane protein implicated in regulation of membrane protease activity
MTTLAFIEQVGGWWDQLTLAQQMFYGIGLLAGLMTLLLAVLAMFGMEHDEAVDAMASADINHDGGGIFSIKPLTGFFLGFGWVGGIALDAGWSLLAALGAATMAGAALMAVVVIMFRAIYAMKSDGTVQVQKAVGAVGTVYVTIPAHKVAGGQVVVNFNGRQETFAALCGAAQPISSGDKVRVLSLVDNRTVLVEAL